MRDGSVEYNSVRSDSIYELQSRQSNELDVSNVEQAKKYYAEAYDVVSRLL